MQSQEEEIKDKEKWKAASLEKGFRSEHDPFCLFCVASGQVEAIHDVNVRS